MTEGITIRRSTEADSKAIRRLALLDDRSTPTGQSLLAFEKGELRAVLPLVDDRPVADPFQLTDHLVGLLRSWRGEPRPA